MDIHSTKTLYTGVEMPVFGLGTYRSTEQTAIRAITHALDAGYRHIDTAAFYDNEEAIGKALNISDVDREDIWVTTKLWNSDHGYEQAKKAFDISLNKLGLDYIDLYLIHWPVEAKRMDSWKALEEIYDEGRAKAIGVSNYTQRHLDEVIKEGRIKPMVNQVEFHPWLFQQDLLEYCNNHEIVLEAYSPFVKGERIDHEQITGIAEKYNKTNAQILVRWGLQHGIVEIPKSSQPERISENSQVFDFEIRKDDMAILDSLNEDYHCTWDPTDQP